jgi:hypothetical protein
MDHRVAKATPIREPDTMVSLLLESLRGAFWPEILVVRGTATLRASTHNAGLR